MGINSNQSEDSNYRGYGGYSGTPQRQPYDADDPYHAGPQSGSQGSAQQQQYSAGQQQEQYSTGQQQQQYYQPPQSATTRSGAGSQGATSTGLNARTEALLSYLFGWVGGLVFLFIERKNSFVRFAAAQSIVLTGPAFIIYVVLQLLANIPLLGLLLAPIASCVTFLIIVATGLIWIFLMVRTYLGMETKLPIISDYAEMLLNRFFRQGKTT